MEYIHDEFCSFILIKWFCSTDTSTCQYLYKHKQLFVSWMFCGDWLLLFPIVLSASFAQSRILKVWNSPVFGRSSHALQTKQRYWHIFLVECNAAFALKLLRSHWSVRMYSWSPQLQFKALSCLEMTIKQPIYIGFTLKLLTEWWPPGSMPCPLLEDVERYEMNTPERWACLVKAWRCKGLHRVQGLPDRVFQHGKNDGSGALQQRNGSGLHNAQCLKIHNYADFTWFSVD